MEEIKEDELYLNVCKICGRVFGALTQQKTTCPDCRKSKSLKVTRAREKIKRPPVVEHRYDMRLCKTCIYRGLVNGNTLICDYLSITGHMRGCDIGPDCDKYTRRTRANVKPRRKEYNHFEAW